MGSDLSGDFPKVRHPAPILSLSNAFDEDDLVSWEERNRRLLAEDAKLQYVLQPKLDGLAIVISYDGGVLDAGGDAGETVNLATMSAPMCGRFALCHCGFR